MVEQGDIIKINFNPQKGHEQAGFRPALVVSNELFNKYTKMAILCPISTNKKIFPLHIKLDLRTETKGKIMCEHVRTMDIEERGYFFVEKLPLDILERVLGTISAEISID